MDKFVLAANRLNFPSAVFRPKSHNFIGYFGENSGCLNHVRFVGFFCCLAECCHYIIRECVALKFIMLLHAPPYKYYVQILWQDLIIKLFRNELVCWKSTVINFKLTPGNSFLKTLYIKQRTLMCTIYNTIVFINSFVQLKRKLNLFPVVYMCIFRSILSTSSKSKLRKETIFHIFIFPPHAHTIGKYVVREKSKMQA